MLCDDCNPCILSQSSGETRAKRHGTSLEALILSAGQGCIVCTRIYRRVTVETDIAAINATGSKLAFFRYPTHKSNGHRLINVLLFIEPQSQFVDVWNYILVPAPPEKDYCHFDLRLSPDNQQVRRDYTNFSSATRSDQVAKLSRLWYQACRRGHAKCSDTLQHEHLTDTRDLELFENRSKSSSGRTEDRPNWYPPRLLDVSVDPARLVPRLEVQKDSEYAALSHCWGRVPFLGLSQEAIPTYEQHGIDTTILPDNFRDAIEICRWLRIPYLWIDSLCIIQAGPGSREDWEHHVNIMRKVYATSDVCIATGATDQATKSCFRDRDITRVAPVPLLFNGADHLLIDITEALRGYENSTLSMRAWALQERLLSRRVLIIGTHQVFRAPTWSWAAHDESVILWDANPQVEKHYVPFTMLQKHYLQLAHEGSPFGQCLCAGLGLYGPLMPLKRNPGHESGLTAQGMTDPYSYILVHDSSIVHSMVFDYLSDMNGPQDGICFMPIRTLSLGQKTSIRGIIVRPTTLVEHVGKTCDLNTAIKEMGVARPCYMRIGWGDIWAGNHVAYVERLPKVGITLL